ncbi:MAG: phosphatidylserine decarboxylase family protein [Candidatus Symbiothrix sp.]|jgi:phosphatidylserine decarboxylase|nr:phosphatidylserine decarboxylase family protein [Candidatus Symbiothrix sp.]
MRIHKEGYKIIFVALILLVAVNVALRYADKNTMFYIMSGISILFFLMIVNFFRNPRPFFPDNTKDIVVAPADGRVVVIEEVFEAEYLKNKCLQISIFMGITNVHVNWMPINGRIIHYGHQDGKFKAAYLPKSSLENERSTVVIERKDGTQILVRQIAGAMARRIVTYAEIGHEAHINEQLGFIKFGSRVDLFLPLDVEIEVELDQKVYGNQTVVAKFKQPAS